MTYFLERKNSLKSGMEKRVWTAALLKQLFRTFLNRRAGALVSSKGTPLHASVRGVVDDWVKSPDLSLLEVGCLISPLTSCWGLGGWVKSPDFNFFLLLVGRLIFL